VGSYENNVVSAEELNPNTGDDHEDQAAQGEETRSEDQQVGLQTAAVEQPDQDAEWSAIVKDHAERPLSLEEQFPDFDPATIQTRVFTDIAVKPVAWLWRGYLVEGALNVLDGDPGVGKSQFACRAAAHVTGGVPLPDADLPGEPGNVLILSHEDEKESVWRPRLQFAGADLGRVISWDYNRDEKGHQQLPEFPADLRRLEYLIIKHKVKLVVIDPLFTYLDSGSETSDDKAMKKALTPLHMLAQRTGCTILALWHLNKNTNGRKLYRGNGSLGGITGSARSVLLMEEDGDRGQVVVKPVKLNGGRKAAGYRFQIEGTDSHVRLVDLGPWDHTAADEREQPPPAATKEEADDKAVLAAVKPGTTTSIPALRTALGWPKKRTQKAVDRLVKAASLTLKEKGAGRRPAQFRRGPDSCGSPCGSWLLGRSHKTPGGQRG
jgi:hypothetical protein